ncbi:MAG: hypothetical protein GY749_15210 [Desulfobacteraceae bacterium]|nr:hypothetical protein [Desulfobacteraceae bacterium]
MLAVAILNHFLIVSINNNLAVERLSKTIVMNIFQLMLAEEKFISSNDPQLLSEYDITEKNLKQSVSDIQSIADNETIKSLAKKIEKLENSHVHLFQLLKDNIILTDNNKKSINETTSAMRDILTSIIVFADNEETSLMKLSGPHKDKLQSETKDFIALCNEIYLNLQNLLIFSDVKKYEETRKHIQEKLQLKNNNLEALFEAINSSEFNTLWGKVKIHFSKISELEEELFRKSEENKYLFLKLKENNEKVRKTAMEIETISRESIKKNIRINNFISIILTSGSIVVLSFLSFVLYRTIMISVSKVIRGVTKGTEQIFWSSEQVTSASHSLAKGNSDQAASSEEISSSLEEVSSMIKQNAGNAGSADNFMKEVGQVIEKANNSVNRLSDSMEEIISASRETSGLVETIDEIAFQTNLLALNAAVEAARAGEAGGGFAVVAGEVRNLAMRTAQAARNTSGLIEGTLEKIQTGGEITSETRRAFDEVASYADKVGKLIAEIAETSGEQALSIGYLNNTVRETDKVTQGNAANAEETASASEEMKAQVEKIKILVNELTYLIG